MRYVILRDDDTNSLTPSEYLEILFRPFLDRGLPITLAVIPNVKTTVTTPDGVRERFLMMRKQNTPEVLPIGSNPKLIEYLRGNPGYHFAQHGYYHDFLEFTSTNTQELANRLDQGIRFFQEAGLPRANVFVAPQDKLSKEAVVEIKKRFPILSTSWFQRDQIPISWWPHYAMKKLLHRDHWRMGNTLFLTRPVQQISYLQPYETILERVKQQLKTRKLSILLTHWWEFFREGKRDDRLIDILHQVADYLANDPTIKVISFEDLLSDPALFNRLR